MVGAGSWLLLSQFHIGTHKKVIFTILFFIPLSDGPKTKDDPNKAADDSAIALLC
jgi:hypothetical protein